MDCDVGEGKKNIHRISPRLTLGKSPPFWHVSFFASDPKNLITWLSRPSTFSNMNKTTLDETTSTSGRIFSTWDFSKRWHINLASLGKRGANLCSNFVKKVKKIIEHWDINASLILSCKSTSYFFSETHATISVFYNLSNQKTTKGLCSSKHF